MARLDPGQLTRMSGSKHTDPPRIRAPRRLRQPYAPRRDGDPATRNGMLRVLKQAGITVLTPDNETPGALPPARVLVHRPRTGYVHPASRGEIRQLLHRLGPECRYGLRSVELTCGPSGPTDQKLLLGSLIVPGRVRLYEQPRPPWLLSAALQPEQAARLSAAEAVVEQLNGGLQTRVEWPDRSLADFMLFDVLLHELAHHVLQQYTGKRQARIARAADHEAVAEALAERWRRSLRTERTDL